MNWHLKNNSITHFWCTGENIFNDEEIKNIITLGNTPDIEKASIENNLGEITLKEDIRKTNINFISPTLDSEWLYRKLTDQIINANNRFFNFNLEQIETLQFGIYETSHFYKPHIDILTKNFGSVRKLSFSVLLSDEQDFTGGDLKIYLSEEPEIIKIKKGGVAFFPSFTLHEVTPVTSGTRISLVGWVLGPMFK